MWNDISGVDSLTLFGASSGCRDRLRVAIAPFASGDTEFSGSEGVIAGELRTISWGFDMIWWSPGEDALCGIAV